MREQGEGNKKREGGTTFFFDKRKELAWGGFRGIMERKGKEMLFKKEERSVYARADNFLLGGGGWVMSDSFTFFVAVFALIHAPVV